MRTSWILAIGLLATTHALAQGIRGVTRRMPTVVPGQTASQFFAAGGVPLNQVNPALATIPGAPQGGGGVGNRGFASAPVQTPVTRPASNASGTWGHRPVAPMAPTGPVSAANTGTATRR